MPDDIKSYRTEGLRLWAQFNTRHGYDCPCLICADTRKYIGRAPLDVRPEPIRRAS